MKLLVIGQATYKYNKICTGNRIKIQILKFKKVSIGELKLIKYIIGTNGSDQLVSKNDYHLSSTLLKIFNFNDYTIDCLLNLNNQL